jgi:hypothetical protein
MLSEFTVGLWPQQVLETYTVLLQQPKAALRFSKPTSMCYQQSKYKYTQFASSLPHNFTFKSSSISFPWASNYQRFD